MSQNTFTKLLFIVLLFLSLNIFAKGPLVDISGNFQSGYKVYDNYNFSPYFDNKDINISTDNFIVGDGLFTNILDSYDCIIGNPPYIRTKNLETSY
mgnify:CR=1 FL=1